ncbi:cyclin-U1-1 [Nicotiana tabacum]|uniref:Cyclin n=2 Tax=Nicotiana TaxID=4085 RepID=A0A1S4C9J4_TOBAC|nr:PREDICTED: cyclin-U1-1 [Nicotiana sylvestris]XP_016497912.1 PREDICTED: cyclin-U1-1-like [Nicotiana tabacum]
MLDEGGSDDFHRRPEPPSTAIDTTTPRVLTILSYVLEKLVARNDQLMLDHHDNGLASNGGEVGAVLGKNFNAFHGVRAPSISIPKYLERLYKYTNCSPSCFVVGYVYIDRLGHKYPDSLLVSLNVHRLLVTCVMVASKMLDDAHYNNAFYARVGGVTNAELNKLELELLFLLDFGVNVSSRVFESYCQYLEKEMLSNGPSLKIERPVINSSSTVDDATEISVEDTQTSSPSQLPD